MRFNFSCDPTDETQIITSFTAEELGAVVKRFKDFLQHVGYHHESVERLMYIENADRINLPVQLDLFGGTDAST